MQNGVSSIWLFFTYLANYTEIGKLLPISPFQRFIAGWDGIEVIQDYLGYINWFIPVSTLLDIMAAWLVCIATFYGVQAILRWIKIVGD